MLRTATSRITRIASQFIRSSSSTITTAPTRHRAMSSTSTSGPAAGAAAAPWRSLFLEHVQGMKSPEFTLGTVLHHRRGAGEDNSAGDVVVPRARTCIFRGMWASLPVNPKNDAELNPAGAAESDCLTFTTDARMDKMRELWVGGGGGGTSGSGHKEGGGDEFTGSGGGAPVEAMFWAEGPMVQWRVRGRAYVIGPDVEESEGGRAVQRTLRARMRTGGLKKGEGKKGEEEWSFARELTAHFGNLSPGMRGSFKNPPPGTPITLPVDDGLALGQKVTDLTDEIARGNFRVVVIVPTEVDRCDLSDPARGRRWLYTYVGEDGDGKAKTPGGEIVDGWEKVEVWP